MAMTKRNRWMGSGAGTTMRGWHDDEWLAYDGWHGNTYDDPEDNTYDGWHDNAWLSWDNHNWREWPRLNGVHGAIGPWTQSTCGSMLHIGVNGPRLNYVNSTVGPRTQARIIQHSELR